MLRQIFCILEHVNWRKQTHTLILLYTRMAWVFNTYLAWYLYDTTLLRHDIVTAWNCYGVTILWHYLRRSKYEHTHWYFDRWEWHNMSVWQLPGILLRRDIVAAWHCCGVTMEQPDIRCLKFQPDKVLYLILMIAT